MATDLTPQRKIIKEMVEANNKYPHGLLLPIHQFTKEEVLKLCEEKRGILFAITSYSLEEFLKKLTTPQLKQ